MNERDTIKLFEIILKYAVNLEIFKIYKIIWSKTFTENKNLYFILIPSSVSQNHKTQFSGTPNLLKKSEKKGLFHNGQEGSKLLISILFRRILSANL